MAWTVPNGCYYAVYTNTWVYYNAGSSVPTERAPNKGSGINGSTYVLLDFSHGYIYNGAATLEMTLNITANNTFTVTSISPLKIKGTCYVYATKPTNLTLTGTQFTFGNGSGLLNKTAFMHSECDYNMNSTFKGRTDITSVTIPSGVYGMYACFEGCESLTTVSTIPSSVDYMGRCFYGCTSLITAPTIPSSVTDMESCFEGCTALAGSVTINGSPSSYTDAFTETVNDIVLLGSGGSNTAIASQYANVYAWSLSSSIVAQRDESVVTSVDISVDVTRFNTGTLTSLSLYKNGGQTPLSVTWNDPTLTITGNTTTFTTTITGIAEGDTPTISVIATDAYGSATEVSVNIPIAFYTMDVQAGGKEIAFGAIATDNLTSHPDGLFRCNMDALFVGTTTEVENPYYSLDTTASQGTTDGDLYAAITDLSWQSGDPLDVKKLLTEMLTMLKEHDVDYIVEQGTSGKWTYRKWASGIAECWGTTSVPSTSYSANGGYKNVTETLPSGLFNVTPPVVIANGRIDSVIATDIGFTTPNNTSTIQTYLINRYGGAVTKTGMVYWIVKGTWK